MFVENFRPGVLARRGLGADDLLARNPRLVYCSISGWGQDGPWANRQAYAPLIHAEAGRIELAARLRDEPPQPGDAQARRHQRGDVRRERGARGAVPGRAHGPRPAPRRVASPRPSCTPTSGARPTSTATGANGSSTSGRTPCSRSADGSDVAMVGQPRAHVGPLARRPRGGSPGRAPTTTPTRSRSCATLVGRGARLPDARGEARGVPDVRRRGALGAELAATPWAEARGVFRESSPGRASWPRRSDRREADIGVRGPAPRAGEHTRSVLARAARPRRRRARRPRSPTAHRPTCDAIRPSR